MILELVELVVDPIQELLSLLRFDRSSTSLLVHLHSLLLTPNVHHQKHHLVQKILLLRQQHLNHQSLSEQLVSQLRVFDLERTHHLRHLLAHPLSFLQLVDVDARLESLHQDLDVGQVVASAQSLLLPRLHPLHLLQAVVQTRTVLLIFEHLGTHLPHRLNVIHSLNLDHILKRPFPVKLRVQLSGLMMELSEVLDCQQH